MIQYRKIFLILMLGLLAVFVQGTLFKVLLPVSASFVVPNLVLVLVIFLAYYEVSVAGVALAFLLGCQLDLSTGVLLGPWAAGFVVAYGMLASISQRVFVDSGFAAVLGTFMGSVLASFVYLACMFQFQPRNYELLPFLLRFFLEAAFSAILAPFVFRFLRFVLFGKRPGSGRIRSVLAVK